MRGSYDHTGEAESRSESHTNRLLYPGAMDFNKRQVQIYPFNYVPMAAVIKDHYVEKQDDDDE